MSSKNPCKTSGKSVQVSNLSRLEEEEEEEKVIRFDENRISNFSR